MDEDSDCEEIKQSINITQDNDDAYLPPEERRRLDDERSSTKMKSQIPREVINRLREITKDFTVTFKDIDDDIWM